VVKLTNCRSGSNSNLPKDKFEEKIETYAEFGYLKEKKFVVAEGMENI